MADKKKPNKTTKPVKAAGPKATDSALVKYFPTFARFMGRKTPSAAPKASKSKKKNNQPSLPMVNLLPPRLALSKARRVTQRGFVIAAVGILTATGLIYAAQTVSINQANASLNAIQNSGINPGGNGQNGQYTAYMTELRARFDFDKKTRSNRIDNAAILQLVSNSMPAGVILSSVSITPMSAVLTQNGANTSQPAANCGPVNDPFKQNTTPIGCLKISGTATDRITLNNFNTTLSGSKLIFNVSISDSSGATATDAQGNPIVTWNGTAAISEISLYGKGN
jgi:hypothetical protein